LWVVVGCGNQAIVLYRRRKAAAAKKTNEAADGRKKTKDGGRHISLAEAKQVFKLLFPVGQNTATKHIAYVAALCLCRTLLNDRVVSGFDPTFFLRKFKYFHSVRVEKTRLVNLSAATFLHVRVSPSLQ
jgi:hypothetical protein